MTQLGIEKAAEDGLEPARILMNHDENLRANALSLACRYYVETIVKDGDLYREMVRDNKVLKPATYMAVLEVAFAFEVFINGELKRDSGHVVDDGELEELTAKDRETPSDEPVSGG